MARQKKEIPKALFNSEWFKQMEDIIIVYTENIKLKEFDRYWYGDRFENDPKKSGVKRLVGVYYRLKIGSAEQLSLFEKLEMTEHDEQKEKRTRKKKDE